jgi:hypothetical protein
MAVSELIAGTGEREVFFQVNGQLRSMKVKDRVALKDKKIHPKVDKSKTNQIGMSNLTNRFVNNDRMMCITCYHHLYVCVILRCAHAWSSDRYQSKRRYQHKER